MVIFYRSFNILYDPGKSWHGFCFSIVNNTRKSDPEMNQHTTNHTRRFYPSSNPVTAVLLLLLVSGFGLYAHFNSNVNSSSEAITQARSGAQGSYDDTRAVTTYGAEVRAPTDSQRFSDIKSI
jgi:hypothetical protein